MKRSVIAISILLGCLSSVAGAWQKNVTFEGGSVGARALGANAFNDASAAVYDRTHVYEGTTAAKSSVTGGVEGWGEWGGVIQFPERVTRGGDLWIRARAYFPSGFSFAANPWLKFMRVRTFTSSGANIGYDDWYIDLANSANPYRFIYEGEQVWSPFGTKGVDEPKFDQWETYEMYIKFDTVSAANGGAGLVRMWKNGKLIGEMRNRITLANATAYSDSFYLFTYWNGLAPKSQSMWVDDIVIQTDTPGARDANGNAFIGVGAPSVQQSAPPTAPVLQIK